MKKAVLLCLPVLMILGGCANRSANTEDVSSEQEEILITDSDAGLESEQEAGSEAQQEAGTEAEAAEEEGIFAVLPKEFHFSGGAGGWGTELFLEADGTFWGVYHDLDMGATGEEYLDGTQYISRFHGKFTEPVQKTDYIYSTAIESIEVEYIEDGVKYIVSEPYGLSGADEILLYLYGIPALELPDGFLSWISMAEVAGDTLGLYGIYNVNEETVFTGVKYEEISELYNHGTYVNELGDQLTIRLAGAIDEDSYELGRVDWIPHDGELQDGTITRNGMGGFSINLPESMSYSFKMTNYELGRIEFVGDGEWSEHLGTFVMQ
ncbi:MAG: hypothetical protein LUI12_04095 [Clostridiales bacterium]|nr:hypothetical protein [Clostridiales bacterium]